MEKSRTHQLLTILREIQNTIPSLINAALTTADGLNVVILLPGSYDDDVSIARSAVMLSTARQLVQGLNFGTTKETVISTADYTYLIMPITDDIFVEALLDNNAKVPQLISTIKLKSQLIASIWEELNMRFG